MNTEIFDENKIKKYFNNVDNIIRLKDKCLIIGKGKTMEELKVNEIMVMNQILSTVKNELKVIDDCYDERMSAEIIDTLLLAYTRLRNIIKDECNCSCIKEEN